MRVSVPTIDGVPVLLPAHDHPEFGDPGRHYHVDFRYCPDDPRQDRVIHSAADPVYVEREAVRPDGYPCNSQAARVLFYLAWKYRNAPPHCGKCPHKGLPVYDGQCVGHGLVFDADGRVVRDFFLRAGSVTLPVIGGCLSYSFVMTANETVDCVEVVTADGRVVVRVPFEGGHQYRVYAFDVLTVKIP